MKTHREFEISPLCLDAYLVNTYTNQKMLIDRRTPMVPVPDSGSDAGEQDVSEFQPEVD